MTRTFPRALFALFILLLTACERAPTLPKLSSHDVIVAFGDSLTHGTGASESTAYPAVLASLTGRTVINAGVPGDTTSSGLKRLPEVFDLTGSCFRLFERRTSLPSGSALTG